MPSTKLSAYCDRFLEIGWLVAVAITPLFFNVYSSRVFEPDKLTGLRTVATLMAATWAVKLIEERISGRREIGFTWRTPLVLPTAFTVVVYLLSTLLSVTPRVSLLGSYQRLQGTYTTLSYIVVFLVILQGLRTRAQLHRLLTVIIINSLPIALYGLIQRNKLDPLPWGGDVTRRVASNMGNPIFVAAYLIMAAIPTLSRVMEAFRAILNDEETSGADVPRAAAYIFIFLVQVIAIWYTQSRGPLVGLLFGMGAWALLGLLRLQDAARRDDPLHPRDLPRDVARGLAFTVGSVAAAGVAALLSYEVSKAIAGPGSKLPQGIATMVAALVFLGAWLVFIVNGHGWRWLWISALTMAVLLAVPFLLINPGGPLHEQALQQPLSNRLARVLQYQSGTGMVRSLIWEGALDLVLPHEPIWFPPTAAYSEGRPDPFNSVRFLVGYGPESMYVAYNRFYPPRLGHYESRTASPDRSHNETIDSLVITGLLGFIAYFWLFGGVFTVGLSWLGFLPSDWRRNLFFVLLGLGAVVAAVAVVATVGYHFFGLAIPIGMMGGFFLYLIVYGFSTYWKPGVAGEAHPHFILLTGILSAVIAHFVEINFGIAIAATRTTFWALIGMLVVAGLNLIHDGDAELEGKSAESKGRGDASGNRRTRRQRRRRSPAPPPRSARPKLPTWLSSVLVASIMGGFVLGTLFFNFVTNAERLSQPLTIIWRALTVLPAQGSITRYGALMVVVLSLLMGGLIFISEMAKSGAFRKHKNDWALASILYLAISLAVGLGFALVLASRQASMLAAQPQTRQELLRLVDAIADRVAGLLTSYYIFVLFVLAAGGATVLLERRRQPETTAHPWGVSAAVILGVLAWSVSLVTNLRPIQADIVYKQGDPYDRQKDWELAIQHYEHANDLAPTEDFYYLWLGRAYLEYASAIGNSPVRENMLRVTEQTLIKARDTNPLNTDHSANLARMYRRWSTYAPDAETKQSLIQRSSENYEIATKLSAQNVVLWNEWALLHFFAQDLALAQEKLSHSLELDDEYDQTWTIQADLRVNQNQIDEAITAYNRAVELNPRLLEVWLRLGDIYASRSQLEEASQAYERALELNPKHAPGWRATGSVYAQLGQFDEAIYALRYALELAPESSDAWDTHRLLAIVFSQLGQNDLALSNAQVAVQLAPEEQRPPLQELITQLEALSGGA